MSELLPLGQAEALHESLLDYLGTTFALTEPDTRQVLEEFLRDPESGLFRGPFVRARTPFRPAVDGWRSALEWHEGFPPYGHQAAAFARLSSYNLGAEKVLPQPTLVTTGTGSGKTEAFLYPILDHVQRANRQGITGTKAVILYPMNALANDQAGRLAELISSNPALGGITAALYTGQDGPQRTRVSADGLITDRAVIRDRAPDILLTNYKMLDQLLLREADAGIWKQSATSLQYLVLDEFHTYDGAQGTDVSMLLRRLGLTLKSYWPEAESDSDSGSAPGQVTITAADRARPLGRITPVATSATLGDKGDPGAMLAFAQTVFGEEFGPDAVITEARLSLDEWCAGAADAAAAAGFEAAEVSRELLLAVGDLAAGGRGELPGSELAAAVLAALFGTSVAALEAAQATDPELLLTLAKAHPLTTVLLETSEAAVPAETALADVFAGRDFGGAIGAGASPPERLRFAIAYFGMLGHLRARFGRAACSVEVHLWIRELTRIDREASGTPRLHWGDDGILLEGGSVAELDDFSGPSAPAFPALYCRHCHRSGWGIMLAPTGSEQESAAHDGRIRSQHMRRNDRFRALIFEPNDTDEVTPGGGELGSVGTGFVGTGLVGLRWWLVGDRRLVVERPDEGLIANGQALLVRVHTDDKAGDESVKDTCPACQQADGIRFLGAAIATMLSVNLSGLFGTPGLDLREKRALVFTDSVQDAAHRAGFIQARSHALTLRALLHQAIGPERIDLESLAQRVLELAGDDPGRRFRALPPELTTREFFQAFWKEPTLARVPVKVRTAVRKRLLLDIELEFGLRSGVGRTLEAAGSVAAGVDVAEPVLLAAMAAALASTDAPILAPELAVPSGDDKLGPNPPGWGGRTASLAWARGILERMRTHGAIHHDWMTEYREADGNRWTLGGGRGYRRLEGMPGFGPGESAPGYPRLGAPVAAASARARDSDLEPIGSARGWYARWTSKCLGVAPGDATVLTRLLFEELVRRDVVTAAPTASGGRTFALAASTVVVAAVDEADLRAGRVALVCERCQATVHGSHDTVDQLFGAPCLVATCGGRNLRLALEDNFYRRMYADTDIQRVVAREHTSLLPDKIRLEHETAFKAANPSPDAPNVLVATPTLEMGIDIGDLSAVLLASLPRTVASYLQRVGRAGRLTGNALALAFVTARGDQLPKFTDPLATINGAVRPPATYLDAEEILRRQFMASVGDTLARRADAPHPRFTEDALGSTDPGSYLGALIATAEERGGELVTAFLDTFAWLSRPIDPNVAARLRQWVIPQSGPGSSGFAIRCHDATAKWLRDIEALRHRLAKVVAVLPDLSAAAHSPAATDSDRAAWRTAQAADRLINHQLSDITSEYWISALETAGLLPNYTLLDDSVSLAVSVSWMDPETQDYKTEPFDLTRGSRSALTEFAPGSTFYANGLAIEIDAVDLGIDGDAVRQWRCCGECGYILDAGADGPTSVGSCPRCGSVGIADAGSALEVVSLHSVSAAVRRDDATIADRTDDRRRETYDVITAADVDPKNITRQWFIEEYGFGVKHLREMTVRWINLGKAAARGSTLEIAGETVEAALFRVCTECGKQDLNSGTNSAREHRPWCSRRSALEESTVRARDEIT